MYVWYRFIFLTPLGCAFVLVNLRPVRIHTPQHARSRAPISDRFSKHVFIPPRGAYVYNPYVHITYHPSLHFVAENESVAERFGVAGLSVGFHAPKHARYSYKDDRKSRDPCTRTRRIYLRPRYTYTHVTHTRSMIIIIMTAVAGDENHHTHTHCRTHRGLWHVVLLRVMLYQNILYNIEYIIYKILGDDGHFCATLDCTAYILYITNGIKFNAAYTYDGRLTIS